MPTSPMIRRPTVANRPLFIAPLRSLPFLFCVVLLAGSVVPAFGQQRSPVTVELRSLAPLTRSGAAVPVEWTLRFHGRGVLAGRLEFDVSEGPRLLGRFRTEEVILTAGVEHRLRRMIPMPELSGVLQQADVRSRFVTSDDSFDLGEQLIRVPRDWQRVFVIGICHVWDTSVSPEMVELEQALRFEQFDPQTRRQPNLRPVLTTSVGIPPDEMSEDPLVYCGFDLVVLAGPGFAQLRQRQLDALLDWVDAGGSLIVRPGGRLERQHADFLNQLAGPAAQRSPFLLDEAGQLVNMPDADRNILLSRKGLGRAAVVCEPDSQLDYDSPAWRRAAAFLWKMRKDRLDQIVRSGHWEDAIVPIIVPFDFSRRGTPGRAMNDLRTVPIQSGNWLLVRLMPESVRTVPLSLMGLILLVYVLVVGPVDYFVLGRLGLRKYTWAVFPIVTFAFAGFTVWLSNEYMRAGQTGRSLVILDVGDGGKIVRENRLQLLFTNTHERVETEVSRGLFIALNHQQFGIEAESIRWTDGRNLVRPQFQPGLVGPALHEGRIPSRYTVTQDVPQWTPQLNRVFTIAPDDDGPAFDWDSLASSGANLLTERIEYKSSAGRPADLLLSAGPDRRSEHEALRRKIGATFGPDASIYVIYAGTLWHSVVANAGNWTKTDLSRPPEVTNDFAVSSSRLLRRPSDFLVDACVRQPAGLFSLVSQTAPTAGHSLEDLPIYDAGDPDQWLLVVLVRRGDDLVAYRKLYMAGVPMP